MNIAVASEVDVLVKPIQITKAAVLLALTFADTKSHTVLFFFCWGFDMAPEVTVKLFIESLSGGHLVS